LIGDGDLSAPSRQRCEIRHDVLMGTARTQGLLAAAALKGMNGDMAGSNAQ
jgi:fructose-1,6-bisphosphatase/sedoheptulose 1,7-bisphosphatase-like protein